MLGVLAFIVPFGLAGAISPMMLTEQTVLLTEPDGRRIAGRYAAGATLVLLAFAGVLVTFGRSIALPQRPHLDAGLDMALGTLLCALAALLWRRRRRVRPTKPHKLAMGTRAALAFGAVSMATNVTTLAVVVPAAKEVAASDLHILGRAVAIATLVILAAAPRMGARRADRGSACSREPCAGRLLGAHLEPRAVDQRELPRGVRPAAGRPRPRTRRHPLIPRALPQLTRVRGHGAGHRAGLQRAHALDEQQQSEQRADDAHDRPAGGHHVPWALAFASRIALT